MRICLTLYFGSSLVLVWNRGPCLDPGVPTVALWSDVRETDWLRPLALWKQTSAIQISGWPVLQHSSWLLHFQLSLLLFFTEVLPLHLLMLAPSPLPIFIILYSFCLFLGFHFTTLLFSISSGLLFFFSFPSLLNLYSHFTSILLNLLVVILSLPLSPASSSFLSLSAPICQAHSPPPTVIYSELLRTGE